VQKQKKVILWPVYFDSSKTRKEGRRVPKNIAVPNPNLAEIQKAAEHLELKPEVETNATYPAIHWRKTGRIMVQKRETKMRTLMKMAKEIAAIRQQTRE